MIKELNWNSPEDKPEEGQSIFVFWRYGSYHHGCVETRTYQEFNKNGEKKKNPFGLSSSRNVQGWLPIPKPPFGRPPHRRFFFKE